MTRARLPALERATVWIALLGVWAGLLAAGLYFNSVDTALRHFTGRIIGHAVAFGVDPALRIRAYVIICGVALGVAAVVIALLASLQQWAHARGHVLVGRSEQRGASLLALVGIGDLTLYVLTDALPYRNGSTFLLLCTALLAVGPVIRLLACGVDRRARLRLLGAPVTQGAIVLLAYQLSVGVGVLMDWPLMLGTAAVGRFLVVWLFLQVTVGIVIGRHDAATARLLRAGLPLLWLPAVAPLANELQYTLRRHVGWTPQALATVMALGLLLAAAGLWLGADTPRPSARRALRLLRRWYFPVVLVSSTLLTLHRQTITIDTVDVFHHGEILTPVLQILRQGRIPYLEVGLPHGLVDIVPQILFGALNGPDRWDILIWGSSHLAGWLPVTVGLALLYALLTIVVSPLAALLVVLFLPAETLVSTLHAPVIICVLALRAFLKHGGRRHAWMLPASVLAVFLWRVDFGFAALVAVAVVLATVRWSSPQVHWWPLLVATGVMYGGTGALAAGVARWRGVSLSGAMRTFWAYVALQVPVGSYLRIYNEMSPLVVLQYLFLPAIGLLIVLHYGVRAVLWRQRTAARVHSLAFLALWSLGLFVRSLQRHSLFEGVFNPYVFLFLLAMFPALISPVRRTLVSALTVAVAVAAIFVLPDSRAFSKDVKWPAIAGGPQRYTFRAWSRTDQRVLVPDPPTDDVVQLLRTHLKPGQTFYDFANAPLLYFLTGAVPPTYILLTTFQVGDDVQRAVIRDLETLRRADRLPLIVFKQNTPFDTVDGIANEIRSYRIAEYIYAHYTPWANAGRFELWIDKTLAAQAAYRLDTGMDAPVVARYPLALQIPATTHNVSVRRTEAGGLALTASGEPAWVENLFVLPKDVAWAADLELYLTLHCTTTAKGILQAVFSYAGPTGSTRNVSEVIASPTADDHLVDVRVPLRLGHEQPPALTGIGLAPPMAATLTVEAAELEIRQPRPGAAPAWSWSPIGDPYLQQFELFRLPDVWANFDDHDPVHNCRELRTLHTGAPIEVPAGQPHVFAVEPADMQSGQYLHLRLQSDTAATVTVAYGDSRHPNTASFMVPAGAEPRDYLIRMSTQWQWYEGASSAVHLASSGPIRLHALRLLAGD